MVIKRDSLGRRIPDFDRKAAGKKGHETRKKVYGDDYNARIGAAGGRVRTRGHFGKLKDEGKTEELRTITTIGARESNAAQGRNPNRK